MIPILYVSSGLVHPSLLARLVVQRALAASHRFAISQVPSLERLPLMNLDDFQALVLYIHHKTISENALNCLERFVHRGGGLLALHSAAASFKTEPRFHALLGGRFDRHGPVETFSVQPGLVEDEIFSARGLFALHDERYLHKLVGEVRVHYASLSGGDPEPFVWTLRHGAGRVCYCAAGHILDGVRHPAVQRILIEGLTWAAGEPR
jgi:type 1 glutamine amidotransferase